MDLGLEGKVALVTGSSRGIGRAIAEELAKEGAHVSLCARGAADLAAAAESIGRYGVRVVATPADVTRPDDVERVVEATLGLTGRVDVLINNAGDIAVGRTVSSSDEEWRATFDTNVLSAVRFTRALVPHLRRQHDGRIINIASVFGRTVPMAGSVDYNASKAALLSFSRTMAVELAADGILVNSVCPGWIETPMLERILDEAAPILAVEKPDHVWSAFEQFLLVRRKGRADEVASLVAYLASARAAYMTGSVYDIDGGFVKST